MWQNSVLFFENALTFCGKCGIISLWEDIPRESRPRRSRADYRQDELPHKVYKNSMLNTPAKM